jgi:Lon-like ATP-dependent protease
MPISLSAASLYRQTTPESLLDFSSCQDQMGLLHPRAHAALSTLLRSPRRVNAMVVDHGVQAWRDWVVEQVKSVAAQRPTPLDVVLVHDFTLPNGGYYLNLPAGYGAVFRSAIAQLVRSIREELPLLFDGHAYQQQVQQLEEQLKLKQEALLRPVFELAATLGIMIDQEEASFTLRAKVEEAALGRQALMQLPEAQRVPLLAAVEQIEQALNAALAHFPALQHAHLKADKALNQSVANALLDPLLARILSDFDGDVAVARYLQELKTYVLARLSDFWSIDDSATAVSSLAVVGADKNWLTVFDVQVMSHHQPDAGVPVIFDPALTLARFLGTIAGSNGATGGEGVVSTLSVRPGVMHAAQGGFLLLTVESLLQEPGLWALLKGMLRGGVVSGSDWRAMQPASLWGGGFDLPDWAGNMQVLLLGEAEWFYALEGADSDVGQLFRSLVEFESFASRDTQCERALMSVLLARVAKDCVLPILPEALAALCNHAARLGEDATRLALLMENLEEALLRAQDEALHAGRDAIDAKAIESALAADRYEAGRLESEYRHAITAGWLNIVTEGSRIGQINGLTVYEVARMAFGQPVKITAQASPGNDGLVDIEKEVDLAGPIHSKGMLIVQGYLRGRFMRSRVMALTASVVMEQTYEGVEGDSASAAETLALLSAIAQLPLRQDIAVTGAINQFGDVQAVGGINEKIEGFFRLCAMRGLTGEQGVLIPAVNVQSLMLAEDVRSACEAGKFHIWSVSHLDESLEMLTGMPADFANAKVLEALETMNPLPPEDDEGSL